MALERTVSRAPLALARALPLPWRRVAVVLAWAGGPVSRAWAGALGGLLRAAPAVPPASLQWLRPLWSELGRYCGWR